MDTPDGCHAGLFVPSGENTTQEVGCARGWRPEGGSAVVIGGTWGGNGGRMAGRHEETKGGVRSIIRGSIATYDADAISCGSGEGMAYGNLFFLLSTGSTTGRSTLA